MQHLGGSLCHHDTALRMTGHADHPLVSIESTCNKYLTKYFRASECSKDHLESSLSYCYRGNIDSSSDLNTLDLTVCHIQQTLTLRQMCQ